MTPLSEIEPIYGIQEYLLERWIDPSEFEKVKRDDGRPDVYHDGTYNWYGGFSRFAPYGPILEIGVYLGFSMAAMMRGRVRWSAVLVDNNQEAPDMSLRTLTKLDGEFPSTTFDFRVADTQTEEWKYIPQKWYSLIHIDACHTYEGCLNDLVHFAPMAADGGIVVVHDTVDEPVRRACEEFLATQDEKWEVRHIPTVNGNVVMRRAG